MTDYSAAGIEERAALDRQTLVELASLDRLGRDDELAAAYLAERLGTSLALVDADEPLRDINNLASPVQAVRDVFDVMAYDSVSDWEDRGPSHGGRAGRAPRPARHLRGGPVRGIVAARRQALEAAEQASVWCGDRDQAAVLRDARRPGRRRRGRGPVAAHPPRRGGRGRVDGLRRAGRVPAHDLRAGRQRVRCGGCRSLRHVGPRLPRRRGRPGRGLRVGLGRARPHRGRHGRRSAR